MEVEFGGFDMVWMGFLLEEWMEWIWCLFFPSFSFFFVFSFLTIFKDVFGFVVKGNRSFMWSWDIWNFHKVCRKICPLTTIDYEFSQWLRSPPCLFFLEKTWTSESPPRIGVVQMIPQLVLTKGCWKVSVQRMVTWYVCPEEDGQRRSGTYLHDEKLGYPTLTGAIRNTKAINNHQDDIEPVVSAVHPQPLETYSLSHRESVSSTGRLLLKQWRRSERIRRDSEWLSWMDETSFRRQKQQFPTWVSNCAMKKTLVLKGI